MKLPNVESVLALARQAGAAVIPLYDSGDFAVRRKADDTPLTEADLTANRIILDGLEQIEPNIPVISEESLPDSAERLAAEIVWLVDPIDGTKEFVEHIPEFTVNIALIYRGEPVLGAVVAPALRLAYWGSQDGGAWKQQADQAVESIKVFSGQRPLSASASRSHVADAEQGWLQAHGIKRIRQAGSSLKLCYVADGTVDVYPRFSSHMSEWDIAAADAVLRAAGGACREPKTGQPLRYNKPDLKLGHFIASARAFS